MGAKDRLTPLDGAGLVDATQLRALAEQGITTVEELAGQLAADRAGTRRLLGLDDPSALRLHAAALEALPAHQRDAFREAADFKPAFGARLPPDDD